MSHEKLNRQKKYDMLPIPKDAKANVFLSDNGSVKVQLKGDWSRKIALELIEDAIRNAGSDILTNPTIYFGNSQRS